MTQSAAITALKNGESVQYFENKTDAEIWRSFNQGDELAFNYIYRNFAQSMFHYGHQFTKDESLVQDCIQNIFINLRRKRGELSSINSIKAYLYKILQREILRVKKTKKISGLDESGLSNSSFLIELSHETKLIQTEINQERVQQINEALNQLTPKQRQAMMLMYEEGLSYKEIAIAMEFSEVKSVRKLIYRALGSIKSIIGVGK